MCIRDLISLPATLFSTTFQLLRDLDLKECLKTNLDIPLNLSPISRSASANAGGRVESRLLKSISPPGYADSMSVECYELSESTAETGGEDIVRTGCKREGKEDGLYVLGPVRLN